MSGGDRRGPADEPAGERGPEPAPGGGSPGDGWQVLRRADVGPGGERLAWRQGERLVTWREVLEGWCADDAVADRFSADLAATPWTAAFWETPPLLRGGLDEPFECVLLDAPDLARPAPEPHVFEQAFAAARPDDVATFVNLGGDALLVAPCPLGEPQHYAHLLAFLRGGPADQQRGFWRALGRAMVQRVGGRPVWLSTSGAGVAWLHARLDDRPKYIQHGPYAGGWR